MPSLPYILAEARVAVTPLQKALRIAGTLELCGMNRSINHRRVQAMLDALPKYFPSITPEPITATNVWSGLRPCSPDGLPFIGRSKRYRNLTVAAGHAMLGVTLAPITGKLVSEVINGHTTSLDIEPLGVERFN